MRTDEHQYRATLRNRAVDRILSPSPIAVLLCETAARKLNRSIEVMVLDTGCWFRFDLQRLLSCKIDSLCTETRSSSLPSTHHPTHLFSLPSPPPHHFVGRMEHTDGTRTQHTLLAMPTALRVLRSPSDTPYTVHVGTLHKLATSATSDKVSPYHRPFYFT